MQPERVLLREVAPLWHRFLNMPRPQPYKNSYWLAEAGVNPLRGSLPSSLLPSPPFFLPFFLCLPVHPSFPQLSLSRHQGPAWLQLSLRKDIKASLHSSSPTTVSRTGEVRRLKSQPLIQLRDGVVPGAFVSVFHRRRMGRRSR